MLQNRCGQLKPVVTSRIGRAPTQWAVPAKLTLRDYYAENRQQVYLSRIRSRPESSTCYLLRLFSADPSVSTARVGRHASFGRFQNELRNRVAVTLRGNRRYVVDQALNVH